jgi:hypothetical protein
MEKISMYLSVPIMLVLVWMYIIFVADNIYRFPCQDPANWGKYACEPPHCEADGTCTEYLIELEEDKVSGKQ